MEWKYLNWLIKFHKNWILESKLLAFLFNLKKLKTSLILHLHLEKLLMILNGRNFLNIMCPSNCNFQSRVIHFLHQSYKNYMLGLINSPISLKMFYFSLCSTKTIIYQIISVLLHQAIKLSPLSLFHLFS